MLKNTIYRSASIQQWLLALALLLSIFSFSGFAKSAENGLPKMRLTEQVYVQKAVAKKKTLAYGFYADVKARDQVDDPNNWAVFTYGLLSKVRYDVLQRRVADYGIACCFLHQKTIPKSFKESVNPNA